MMKQSKAFAKPTAQVSNIMKANKASNTTLEVIVRKELWRRGYRGYRLNYKSLPGKPDIVFSKFKLAIFIHGCFWHACPKCNRSKPKKNATFWQQKFTRNKERDLEVAEQLQNSGWVVLILWECEVKNSLDNSTLKITRALADKRLTA